MARAKYSAGEVDGETKIADGLLGAIEADGSAVMPPGAIDTVYDRYENHELITGATLQQKCDDIYKKHDLTCERQAVSWCFRLKPR